MKMMKMEMEMTASIHRSRFGDNMANGWSLICYFTCVHR